MSNRRYYTCPLQAAYMAKNFGMRFVSWDSGKEYDIAMILANASSPVRSIRENQRYVVHPDSLPLLEPVVGDLVETIMKGYAPVWLVFRRPDFSQLHANIMIEKIIQRNGLPFFWPETEEAK